MIRRWLQIALVIAAGWVLWTVCFYLRWGGRHRAESAWFVLAAISIAVAGVNSRGEPAVRDEPSVRGRGGVELLVALCVGFLLYWPATRIGLLSDDYVLLARSVSTVLNPYAWEHFRPLPLLSWKALYPAGGPIALHALNIALHAINASLVWRLSIRLGHREQAAAFAAAVFLFFPAAVEPVAWNSGIFDIATVFFGLLYLHGAIASTTAAQALGVAALVAALLSKETAVVLPVVALILSWRTRLNGRAIALSMAIAGTYVIVRVLTGADVTGAVVPAGQSVRYAVKEALVRPFATLGAPWTQSELLGGLEGSFFLGVLPIAILIALIVSYSFRPHAGLRPLTHLAWVLLGTAPLAGFLFVSNELQGSRYLYLPLCGWSLFLGDLVNRIDARRSGPIVVTALLAAAVGFGFWGVRHHLDAWERAAALRDTLLAEAHRALQESGCSGATFESVPADYGSAQLFRNGFEEAIRGMQLSPQRAPCRFVWDGTRFVRP